MKQNLAETNIFEEAKRRDILSLAKSLGLQFSSPKRSSCLNGCGSRNKASVSYYNNRFYCHNCNEGGSVIDLVMLAHGFSNIEAAEFLTERTRVKSFDYKKPTKSLSKQKVKLFDYSELYKFLLEEVGDKFEAWEYLKSRGLSQATAERSGFSIIPLDASERLLKNFPRQKLEEAGLFTENGFLFFRHRLLIPFTGESDKIVTVQGRDIDGKNPVKYLLAKGRPQWVYRPRLDAFNHEPVKFCKIVICESAIDALSGIELGLNNCVGLSGVNGLPGQFVEKLRTMTVYVIGDNDKAGESFAQNIKNKVGITVVKNIDFNNLKDYFKVTEAKDLNDICKASPLKSHPGLGQYRETRKGILTIYGEKLPRKILDENLDEATALIQRSFFPKEQRNLLYEKEPIEFFKKYFGEIE